MKTINQPISDLTMNELKGLISIHHQFKDLFNKKSVSELGNELSNRRNDLIDQVLE